MQDEPKPDDAPPKTEVGKSPGYIPRPPSKEDVERVSGQQGMISDEWAPAPPPDAEDDAAAKPPAAAPGKGG